MQKIQFGDTEEKVSQMAMGGCQYGTKLNKEESFEFLDYYFEAGGTFLDTANNYSFWEEGGQGGESETIFGEWMKSRKNRKEIFLATKVGAFPVVPKDKFLADSKKVDVWTEYTEGLSPEVINSSVEASLERLQTDYIDLYYAHVDVRRDNLEKTLETFDGLIKSGKVRHIGCSNYRVWRMMEAKSISRRHGWAEYSANQMFHTYYQTEKGAETGMGLQMAEELMDYARSRKDITLLGYTPLIYGAYTREEKYEQVPHIACFKRAQNIERKQRLEQVSRESGATVNQIIYAWMMQNDPPVIPLIGATKMEHLKENIESVNVKLSGRQLALLNSPLN